MTSPARAAASSGRGLAASTGAAGGWFAADNLASTVPFSATVMSRPFAITGEANARPAVVRPPALAPVLASRRLTLPTREEATASIGAPAPVRKPAGDG